MKRIMDKLGELTNHNSHFHRKCYITIKPLKV